MLIVTNWLLKTWPSWVNLEDELRQLKLSNWEIIWDFIWNSWELVSPFNLMNWENEINKYYSSWLFYSDWLQNFKPKNINIGQDYYYNEIQDNNFRNIYWPKIIDSANISFWTFKYSLWKTINILTWGDYNLSSWKSENWLYSILKVFSPSWDNYSIRCTYTP